MRTIIYAILVFDMCICDHSFVYPVYIMIDTHCLYIVRIHPKHGLCLNIIIWILLIGLLKHAGNISGGLAAMANFTTQMGRGGGEVFSRVEGIWLVCLIYLPCVGTVTDFDAQEFEQPLVCSKSCLMVNVWRELWLRKHSLSPVKGAGNVCHFFVVTIHSFCW